jgi:hypothetical protein
VSRPLSPSEIDLINVAKAANEILRGHFFPGQITKVSLDAERRVIVALITYDDGQLYNVFCSAIFANPLVLAACVHSSFLITRIHWIGEQLLDSWEDPKAEGEADMGDAFALTLNGERLDLAADEGDASEPATDEQRRRLH